VISYPEDQKGFTLIEVVAVLMLTSIVGVMLIQYVRAASDHTADQVSMVRDTLALQQEMELVTSRYKTMLNDSANTASLSILTQFFNQEVNGYTSTAAMIDTTHTKYITFTRDASTLTYTPSTSNAEQNNSHLMLVLVRGNQRVYSFFSDSE
jgi:prepilin-type N-terminal cleavage/methylation domain-containing protein